MSQNDRKAAENRKLGETPQPKISFTHHFAANTTANQFVIKPVVKEGAGTCFEIVTTATKVQAEPKKDEEVKSSLVEAFCKQTDQNRQQKKAPEPKSPEMSGGAKQRHTSTIFIGSSKKKEEASNKEAESREKSKAMESSKPNKGEEGEPRSRRQRGLNKIKSSGSLVTDPGTVKKVVTISAKNLEAKTISLTNSKPGGAAARKVYTRKLNTAGGKPHNSNVSSSSSESEASKKQEGQKSKAPEAEEVNAREQRRNRRMRARMVGNKQQQKPHLLKQQLSAENVVPAKTETKKTSYRRQRRSKELKAGGGGREKNQNMNIPPSMIKRSHPWAKQIFMLSNELSDEDKYSTLPANFRPTYDLAGEPKKFGGNQQGGFRNFKPAGNARKEKFPGFKETVSLDDKTSTMTPIKTPPRNDSKRGFVKRPSNVQPSSNKHLQNNQFKKTSSCLTEKLHNGSKKVEQESLNKQSKNLDRVPSNADLSLNEEKETKQESENESSRNALVIARPLAKAKKIGEHFWPRDKDTEKLLGKNNLSQESAETSVIDKTDTCTKADNSLITNVEKDEIKPDEKDTNLNLEVNNNNSKEEEKSAVGPKKCTNPFLNFSDSELNNPLEEELKKFSKITQDMKGIEEKQNAHYKKENSFNFDKINPSLANLGSSRNINDEINRTSQRKDSVVSMSTALPTRKPSHKQISSADYDEAVIEIDEVLNEFQNIAYDKNTESETPAQVDQYLQETLNASTKVENSDDKLLIPENAECHEEKHEEESYDSFAAADTISSSTSSQKRPASADAKTQKKKSHSDPNTNAVRKASLLSNVEVEKRPNSCSEPLMGENYDTLSGLDKYKRYQISKTLQSSKQQKRETLKPHRSSGDIYSPEKLQGEIPDFENQFELGKEEKQFREMCDILTSSTSQASIHQPDYAPSSGQVISHSRSCSAPVNPTSDGYVEAGSRRYATVEPSMLEDMKGDEEMLGSKKGISTSADNLNSGGELRGKYLPVSLHL